MTKFIKKLFLFIILITIILSGAFYYFYKIGGDDLPAPNLSNSISFNEKIDFIKDKDLSKIEYIVLGSSMALNNIDSETMVKYCGENFLNLASWGFKISDSNQFVGNLINYFPNLKTVILSTNLMDYSDKRLLEINIEYSKVKRVLNNYLGIFTYLTNFNLKYFYNNSKENKQRTADNNSYQSLNFDRKGGVVISIKPDKIDPERWSKNLNDYKISDYEVSNLIELIKILKEKKIELIIAISPLRPGSQNKEDYDAYTNEINKIQNITVKENVKYINTNDFQIWDDSLFVDYAHLNKFGCSKYTELVISKFKQ
jgi:hypothetical protein